MIETLVLLGHLVVAGLIIGLVLLQRGKGAEAGTGFGAGASGTVFGSRGSASFFSRATAILATLFFATSLALTYFATRSGGPDSLLGDSVTDQTGAGVQPAPGSETGLPAASSPTEEPNIPVEPPPEAGGAGSSSPNASETPAAATSGSGASDAGGSNVGASDAGAAPAASTPDAGKTGGE